MSKQNKSAELEHARKILHNPEMYWNEGTKAGRRGSMRRADWVARMAKLAPGMCALEIGCGTGFFSQTFMKTGAELHGIDISPELLEKARERVPSGVQFFECDVERLPYPDAHFDAVVGIRVLHHLDMNAAFKEIARVLKPGGRLAFCEPNMMNPQIMVQKNVPWIKERMGDTPDETAFFKWGLRKFLKERGFAEISIDPFDFLHPFVPDGWIPWVEKAGSFFERVPVLREIGGSLQIFAVKCTSTGAGRSAS